MRDYDISLLKKIKEKEHYKDLDGIKVLVKKVPDDDRDHVLDPRVLAIAKKKKEASKVKKFHGLSSERYRPDKISYDLTTIDINVEERLISIDDDHMIDIYIHRRNDCDKKVPVLIYFHGGGYIAGDYKLYANQMKYICELSDAVVIFPEYRLAPECPYPGPIHDCRGTIEYVVKNAEGLNIDVDKLMVASDSAGGGLLNSCMLLDDNKYIKKGFELYPAVDYTPLDKLKDYSWSYDMYPVVEEQKNLAYGRIDKIKKSFETEKPELNLYTLGKVSYKEPLISIVYASEQQLRALPPITVVYCEYDFLRESNKYFSKKLAALHKDIKVIEYCGCDHGFLDCLGLVPQAEDVCYEIVKELKTM